MEQLKTSDVAKATGIHVNTVRFYEELGFIPKAERKPNGYRIFTQFHIEQIKLLQIGFEIPLVQSGLRKQVRDIIVTSAKKDLDRAIILANEYMRSLNTEEKNANEAVDIVKNILNKQHKDDISLKRKETAEYLNVTVDSLRNWEMNGLLKVKRSQNGYRIYTCGDIDRLKIIRTLRYANYSLEAILRMLNKLSADPEINIKKTLNTPAGQEEFIYVCDELILSIKKAKFNTQKMITQLEYMKK